ncbi:hypothetical protein Syun_019082 [Stephania yunnanensis]|uniref:Uncharacterized protein n=1 Tax=Stephania yunnanensis TaxID=152371 RepID=A0AAP0NXM1_9MAGN
MRERGMTVGLGCGPRERRERGEPEAREEGQSGGREAVGREMERGRGKGEIKGLVSICSDGDTWPNLSAPCGRQKPRDAFEQEFPRSKISDEEPSLSPLLIGSNIQICAPSLSRRNLATGDSPLLFPITVARIFCRFEFDCAEIVSDRLALLGTSSLQGEFWSSPREGYSDSSFSFSFGRLGWTLSNIPSILSLLREVDELYKSEKSLLVVEVHRHLSGLHSIALSDLERLSSRGDRQFGMTMDRAGLSQPQPPPPPPNEQEQQQTGLVVFRGCYRTIGLVILWILSTPKELLEGASDGAGPVVVFSDLEVLENQLDSS